jgi:hypothetical protein
MHKSTTRRRSGHGEILPPLTLRDRIADLLTVQVQTFPQKDLTTAEVDRWVMDLSGYRQEAIEFAFDNWRRNGNFFPVPSDILSLCDAWMPKEQVARGCSKECKSRHGKGYGENDVLFMMREYMKQRAVVNRALDEHEWEAILVKLDKVRGGAPEFRL